MKLVKVISKLKDLPSQSSGLPSNDFKEGQIRLQVVFTNKDDCLEVLAFSKTPADTWQRIPTDGKLLLTAEIRNDPDFGIEELFSSSKATGNTLRRLAPVVDFWLGNLPDYLAEELAARQAAARTARRQKQAASKTLW